MQPPLIHYYFRTMDDLYAAVVRRMSEQALDQIEKALQSSRPFQAVWAVVANPRWARFTMEFMALANQNKTVREVIAQQIEKVRRLEVQALARHREAGCVSATPPVLVGPVLMTAAAYLLTIEAALGVSLGHAETKAYVEGFLRACRVWGGPVRGMPTVRSAPILRQNEPARAPHHGHASFTVTPTRCRLPCGA